jgi:hypothetical protein
MNYIEESSNAIVQNANVELSYFFQVPANQPGIIIHPDEERYKDKDKSGNI